MLNHKVKTKLWLVFWGRKDELSHLFSLNNVNNIFTKNPYNLHYLTSETFDIARSTAIGFSDNPKEEEAKKPSAISGVKCIQTRPFNQR